MSLPRDRHTAALESRARAARNPPRAPWRPPEPRQVALGAGILLFVVLASALASVGLAPAGLQLREGATARQQVVAEMDFAYASALARARLQDEAARLTPTVYRHTMEPFEQFRAWLLRLRGEMAALEPELVGQSTDTVEQAYARLLRDLARDHQDYRVDPRDLAYLRGIPEAVRDEALEVGLRQLGMLYDRGIAAPPQGLDGPPGERAIFTVARTEGGLATERPLLEDGDEVQTELRRRLFLESELTRGDLPIQPFQARALLRVLLAGVRPNLLPDVDRTEARRAAARAAVPQQMVSRRKGDLLIEPGVRVTSTDEELLRAYRDQLARGRPGAWVVDSPVHQRLLLTALLTALPLLALRQRGISLRAHRRALLLAGTAMLLNLALLRLLLELAGADLLALTGPGVPALLPYLVPFAFAPLLVVVLAGPLPGYLVALAMAGFAGMMLGQSYIVLLSMIAAGVVGVGLCREVQVRARVVRAGVFAGLVMGLLAALRPGAEPLLVVQQIIAAVLVGAVTGVLVVGLLPVFEALFGFTSSIKLLELTDTNNPLLQRLQVEAPGTYHHSLMVANLSERAAAAIGADRLLTRACALYHDIGKLAKPEYFTENQRQGENPHLFRNPSMSALIIKAHVKEGVALAQKHKLPRPLIDVIQQHHGTSLIQYFYYRALERRRGAATGAGPDQPLVDLDTVAEETYRYEGPRPRFKESAIIFFADSVEAASRALKKVTMQSVKDLIDPLVAERLADHQLAECPLTMAEINEIKQSFGFSLMNMLHSRIEYPKKDETPPPVRAASGGTASPIPFPVPPPAVTAEN